jgi:hypothetical protein
MNELLLVYRNDATGTDVDSIDLAPFLADNGWVQSTPEFNALTVDEAITLHLSAGTDPYFEKSNTDMLAEVVMRFHLFEKYVDDSQKSTDAYPFSGSVWLRTRQNAETGYRQASIKKMKLGQIKARDSFSKVNILTDFVLGLTRNAKWEGVTAVTVSGTISTRGGVLGVGSADVRDFELGARAAHVIVSPVGEVTQKSINRVWIGSKVVDSNTESLADFRPIWDVADFRSYWQSATYPIPLVGADTTDTGSNLTCTFATVQTMATRAYFHIMDFVNMNALGVMKGRYQVLIEAKVTGSASVRIRGGGGYVYPTGSGQLGFSDFTTRGRVPVTNTVEKLLPLGEFKIPAIGNAMGGNDFDSSAIRIEAELYSGSGSLVITRLVLIPCDGGYMTGEVSGSGITYCLTEQDSLHAMDHPSGTPFGLVIDNGSNAVVRMCSPEFHDFGLWSSVEQAGVLVAAAAVDSPNVLSSQMTISITAFKRYNSMRGYD